jgi:hypothetical protein
MTTRASDSDVRSLVDMAADRSTTLYLTIANTVVNEQLAVTNLSEATLTAIEQFLAAHFAVLGEERGGLSSSGIGNRTKEDYMKNPAYGAGFTSTRWGLQAIALDTTGTLMKMSAKKGKASIRVVRRRPFGVSAQPYVNTSDTVPDTEGCD